MSSNYTFKDDYSGTVTYSRHKIVLRAKALKDF